MFGQKKNVMLFGEFLCINTFIVSETLLLIINLYIPAPRCWHAIHVMPPMLNTLQNLQNAKLVGCIGWGSMRPGVFHTSGHPRPTEKSGLVLLTAEGLSTIQGSSHLTGSLGIHGDPWGSWASKWETYRLSTSHHKHPCFTSSTGGMNKDNQRARTNYFWTLDFGKSMIKSDSESFIFHIRQRDVGITWPNHAESGPCYYI